jgi:prevent-host-death family protein
MQTMPFSSARAHFAEVLLGVENAQEPVLISRRGKAAGVIMSLAQYQALAGAPQSFAHRLAQWRVDYANEINDVDPFSQIREQSEGRAFSW